METFCGVDFREESIEELKELFEQREEQWIDKVVLLKEIDKIWVEIKNKELYQSEADHLNAYINKDNIMTIFSPNDTENSKEIVPDIIMETEGEFSVELRKEREEREIDNTDIVLKEHVSQYINRFRIVRGIEPIRFVLDSEELLADILINIYYSIHFYFQKDEFSELYDGNADFSEGWRQYCKKGRAGSGRDNSGVKREKAVGKEKDFVQTTGNKLPITCKIKSRSNQGPLIQDVVPNIFRMFIMENSFVNKYNLGKLEKYCNVKDAYTKYSYSISEQYILEEILGVYLSKSIYNAFLEMFSQLSLNAIMNGGEKGKLELLIQKLLCWRGQNSRVLLVRNFRRIFLDGGQRKICSYEWASAKEDFVEEMLGICIRWTNILIEKGTAFYEVLYREMLYILWKQAGGKLDVIEKRCEKYLKENEFLPVNIIREFGKCNKDSGEEKGIEKQQMYCWIQKYVLSGIESRAEARKM